jgi:pimeloyl-ACP methyl ester carboxylesterase
MNLGGRENQTHSLPDGRVLGYAEYGYPNGFPVFVFHGFPTSRLEFFAVDKPARRRRLRIIALDRPGFGLSTFQPHRRITDWPADVLAFAQDSRIDRFAIFGMSGGGPYALACAHALPREMLSAVGLFASAPPWEAGPQYMPWYARFTSWAANSWPTAFGALTNAVIATLRWIVTTGPVVRWIDKALESATKAKKEKSKAAAEDDYDDLGLEEDDEPTTAERRHRLIRLGFEGFAQGSEGFVQEAQLLSAQDWGFKFEDIDYDPIKIWHGSKDVNAPVRMIRYMAKHLPHSELQEFENDTHFTMHKYVGQVFSELVPEGALDKTK